MTNERDRQAYNQEGWMLKIPCPSSRDAMWPEQSLREGTEWGGGRRRAWWWKVSGAMPKTSPLGGRVQAAEWLIRFSRREDEALLEGLQWTGLEEEGQRGEWKWWGQEIWKLWAKAQAVGGEREDPFWDPYLSQGKQDPVTMGTEHPDKTQGFQHEWHQH